VPGGVGLADFFVGVHRRSCPLPLRPPNLARKLVATLLIVFHFTIYYKARSVYRDCEGEHMLSTVKELLDCSIHATDGNAGRVEDVLFDDRAWMVRYLVVDTGNWLTSRPLLIPAAALLKMDRTAREVDVNMSREQVMQCRGLETDMPVWRQMAQKYWDVSSWPVLWFEGFWTPVVTLNGKGPAGDPHLRSASKVIGYHMRAQGGEVGHVVDFLFDDDVWCLRDFVAETGHWHHARKVLVPPHLVQEVSWPMSTVFVDLPRDRVSDLPDFVATPQLEPVRVPARRRVRT
jgi:uncharacterized protein YrrD